MAGRRRSSSGRIVCGKGKRRTKSKTGKIVCTSKRRRRR